MTKSIEVPGIALPPQIVDDLTRRQFLVGAGLIALAPACGSGGEGGDASGRTRMVTDHLDRDVEVPDSPSRIAITNVTSEGDPVIALGIEPIAAPEAIRGRTDDYAFVPQGALDDAASIGEVESVNLEALAAASPDLIFTSNFGAEDYGVERLQQIAPTVVVDFGGGRSIWDQVELVAQAAGVPERVDDIRAEYNQAAVAVDEVTNNESVLVVRPFPDRLSTYHGSPRSPLSAQFEAAGLRLAPPLPEVEADEFGGVPDLSLEFVPDLEGDLMLVWLLDMSEERFREQYLSTPLWQRNPLVADGRVRLVAGDELSYSNLPLQAQLTFETLREIFTGGDESS